MHEWVTPILSATRVIDGDTYWLIGDLGFRVTASLHIRLADYDTPELFRPHSEYERTKAREAKSFVEAWFLRHLPDGHVYMTTMKDPEAYGRWVGEIWTDSLGERQYLGQQLRDQDLASLWPVKWRDEFGAGE